MIPARDPQTAWPTTLLMLIFMFMYCCIGVGGVGQSWGLAGRWSTFEFAHIFIATVWDATQEAEGVVNTSRHSPCALAVFATRATLENIERIRIVE